MGHERDYSEDVAGIVDEEVRRLIEAAHDEAWTSSNENRDVLDHLVLELLEHETLNKEELAEIFADVVHKRPQRPVWLSSDRRTCTSASRAQPPRSAGNGNGAHPAQDEQPVTSTPRPRSAGAQRAAMSILDTDR
jgi:cell division protease FtsH